MEVNKRPLAAIAAQSGADSELDAIMSEPCDESTPDRILISEAINVIPVQEEK